MEWKFILVLILAIPVIIFPAAFIWYLNLGGLYKAICQRWQINRKEARPNMIVKTETKELEQNFR